MATSPLFNLPEALRNFRSEPVVNCLYKFLTEELSRRIQTYDMPMGIDHVTQLSVSETVQAQLTGPSRSTLSMGTVLRDRCTMGHVR